MTTTWIKDANGNRCSVEYFGSEELAKAALDRLKNCRDCTDCSACSGCSNCWRCSGCSDCSGCTDCSACSGCSDCSGCSGCSDCSNCTDCSDCSDCWRCSGCWHCSGCWRCSGCSDCSSCSDCSGCSNCSGCSRQKNKAGDLRVPVIPAIENIHQRIFEAATANPDALAMNKWHTCDTTHCRAGWAVHLAGEAGYALEGFHNTALAAQLIYRASGYEINPCRFYDSKEDALSDMKRLAEEDGRV